MKIKFLLILLLSSTAISHCIDQQNPKIVGLVGIRNEQRFIRQCLKALSLYTDAIVVLDDASDDNTVAIIESLAQECHIEVIIKKEVWYRDETGDRNKLLQAGRQLGGTHFILLDADEMFSANCLEQNFLRKFILSLKKGEKLVMPLIDLWRSPYSYRIDKSPYAYRILDCAFCDDGVCYYDAGFIHASHSPNHLTGKEKWMMNKSRVVLHFAFVNWEENQIKYAWYKCLERIRLPEKSIESINADYDPGTDEKGIKLVHIPEKWIAGYDFFDPSICNDFPLWRAYQIVAWFKEYGKEYFNGLHVDTLDWSKYEQS
jgi:glycosyltransferase involved in cell wall biosynthesis